MQQLQNSSSLNIKVDNTGLRTRSARKKVSKQTTSKSPNIRPATSFVAAPRIVSASKTKKIVNRLHRVDETKLNELKLEKEQRIREVMTARPVLSEGTKLIMQQADSKPIYERFQQEADHKA